MSLSANSFESFDVRDKFFLNDADDLSSTAETTLHVRLGKSAVTKKTGNIDEVLSYLS